MYENIKLSTSRYLRFSRDRDSIFQIHLHSHDASTSFYVQHMATNYTVFEPGVLKWWSIYDWSAKLNNAIIKSLFNPLNWIEWILFLGQKIKKISWHRECIIKNEKYVPRKKKPHKIKWNIDLFLDAEVICKIEKKAIVKGARIMD